MKLGPYVAGLILLAGAAAGCGSSDSSGGSDADSAPKAATEQEFCDGFTSLTADMGDVSGDDTAALIKKVKEAASQLKATGTPDGIPAEARDGFEVFIDTISSVDDDATMAELQEVGNDLDADDEKSFEAFGSYLSTTCAPTTAPSPSDSAS